MLMDAHEWHGNTAIEPDHDFSGQGVKAERISCVLYYRTRLQFCKSRADELTNAKVKDTARVRAMA